MIIIQYNLWQKLRRSAHILDDVESQLEFQLA